MAEAMAGFHGAGMLNAIFMNDSSRVLLLNTCTINTFYHTELHQLQRDLVCEIPERVGMERLMQDETYRDWFYDIDMAKEFPQFFRKYKAADILDYIKSRGEVFRML